MAVEWVKYSRSLAFAAGPAADNFRIDASLREEMPSRILSAGEVAGEVRELLQWPAWRRTFLIGPFTSRIDPVLGGMREKDIAFIEGVHQFYDGLGVDCYSAFRREEYGQL